MFRSLDYHSSLTRLRRKIKKKQSRKGSLQNFPNLVPLSLKELSIWKLRAWEEERPYSYNYGTHYLNFHSSLQIFLFLDDSLLMNILLWQWFLDPIVNFNDNCPIIKGQSCLFNETSAAIFAGQNSHTLSLTIQFFFMLCADTIRDVQPSVETIFGEIKSETLQSIHVGNCEHICLWATYFTCNFFLTKVYSVGKFS